MSVTIKYPRRIAEYRPARIPGELYPPHSYLQIDMRDGSLRVGYTRYDGLPTTDPDVVARHVLRFTLNPHLKVRQVRALMDAVKPLMELLVSSYGTYEDKNGNLCGRFDLDAMDKICWAMSRLNMEIK